MRGMDLFSLVLYITHDLICLLYMIFSLLGILFQKINIYVLSGYDFLGCIHPWRLNSPTLFVFHYKFYVIWFLGKGCCFLVEVYDYILIVGLLKL